MVKHVTYLRLDECEMGIVKLSLNLASSLRLLTGEIMRRLLHGIDMAFLFLASS